MSTETEVDEYTPRERGLLIGHRWAREVRRLGVVAVADDEIYVIERAASEPPDIAEEQVRRSLMENCGVRECLDASEYPDAESEFWGGRRDGVRAFLVEQKVGGGSD